MKRKKILLACALVYGFMDVSHVYSYNSNDYRRSQIKEDLIGLGVMVASMLIMLALTVYLDKKEPENSNANVFLPNEIKERFSSVAGANEAKEELQEIVSYLQNSKEYTEIGAKIRKGILLTGTPGNGKTLLARAFAGEVGCPFVVITASDLENMWVGGTAAQIRSLFATARKLAEKYGACIIFIDEIDAIGGKRGSSWGYKDAGLNKLLTEMDGFKKENNSIVVLGATNRPEMLDEALLRPGRFDRIISVKNPDAAAREEVLKIHSAHVKLDPSVDLKKIAQSAIGFSGAELANLINESALIAHRFKSKTIKMGDIEEAIDTLRLGKKSENIVISAEERRMTAFHEAGHALVTLLNPMYATPLHKVTIAPRGGALGVTYSLPERDKFSTVKEEMIAYVMHCLGGRVAEEITFSKITTGAYSDCANATNTVRLMVCSYGMSEKLGFVVYAQGRDAFVYSQETAKLIDDEVLKIMNQCYKDTKKLLLDNKDKLEKLANALLEKETMHASEIYELLGITPR